MVTQGSGNAVTSGTLDGNMLVLNKDLTFATDQSNTNSFWELREDLNGKPYLYANYDIATLGGHTMYYQDGEVDLPSIIDEIGIAGYDGKKLGLVSFSSSQFSIDANGNVTIKGGSTGLDTAQLKDYLDSNKYTTEAWVKAQDYASASSLSSLQTKVNNFLEGSDTDTIINKWKELEVFLSGLSESDNLATILAGKADKSYVDANFVTLGTKQTITGEKNFTGGLRVNNSPSIYYDATNKYWKLEGDLLVTGGVTMYGTDEGDLPSILDSLPIASTSSAGIASFDSTYFSVNASGKVTLTSAPSMVSILGSLQDVSSSVSGTTNSDVVLFKSANTSTWTTKPLSEIGGGSSGGGSVSGAVRYLSTLGSTGVWYDTHWRLYAEWGAHSRVYLKTEDGYDVVANLAEKDGNGNVIASTYLPLSGGTIESNSTSPLAVKSNVSECGIRIELESNSRGWIGYNLTHGVALYNYFSKTYGVSLRDNGNVILCQEGGYVGVGVASPDCGLDVAGDIATNNYLRIKAWPGYGSGSCSIWFDGNSNTAHISSNILVSGGITMYSDQRKKTILNHVELSLKQIANAPLIEHYYNLDQEKTTHVGSIAQYWASLNDWFCKLDAEGFYTMEIQNCALASAISIARHLEKFESKTDKKIRMLKKRITELEDKLEKWEGGNYGC